VTAMVDVRLSNGQDVQRASAAKETARLTVPLQLAPSVSGARGVTASLIPIDRAPLLRRLAYALSTSALDSASLARVKMKDPAGIAEYLVLRIPSGVDAIPLGAFFSERPPGLFVLAGHDLVPACTPAHLARAIGASTASNVFVWREPGDPNERIRAFSIDGTAYVPLASALVEPESWGALMPVEVVELARTELEEKIGTVAMGSVGIAPLTGALGA